MIDGDQSSHTGPQGDLVELFGGPCDGMHLTLAGGGFIEPTVGIDCRQVKSCSLMAPMLADINLYLAFSSDL